MRIDGPDSDFKGFLFRLSSDDASLDLSDSIFLLGNQDDKAQTFPNAALVSCPDNVGAACDSNGLEKKSSVEVTLSVEEEVSNMLLEVTVVRNNKIIQGFDDWYYLAYNIDSSVDPTSSPAPSPSNADDGCCESSDEKSELLSIVKHMIGY